MTSATDNKMDYGNSNSSNSADAALLLDRFVSSSSAEDVSSSLDSILRGLQKGDISPDEVYNELEVLNAFVQVLQSSKYKDLPVEDSLPTVGRIFIEMFNKCTGTGNKDGIKTLLSEPSPGRLIESAIDVASSTTEGIYTRVVCLQLLHVICKSNARLAQQQLMQAPNGLHRLGDLLRTETADGGDSVPEQVRNEALLLASTVAEWPSAAKVWMFNEVGDVVIQTAIREGGLTGGNVLVLDCLKLLQNMLKHDASLADLVFQSPVVGPSLARLLDLRNGNLYKNPPPVTSNTVSNVAHEIADDDLDALIASGSSARKKKQLIIEAKQPPEIVVPYLTIPEERIIEAVFDILSTVLENENVKLMIWKKHIPLGSLIWEMGLITPPPPGTPYPCAVPSIRLQQRALQIIALYFSDVAMMDRHAGLDRLLYLICTGGGSTGRSSTSQAEKMQLQQSALHAIRKTLTGQITHQMLLYTMIPDMVEDEARTSDDPQVLQRAQVVRKLLNTVHENLVSSPQNNDAAVTINGTKQTASSISRNVFLSGSLGALALFFNDEASRSIFLRITTSGGVSGEDRPSLVDAILDCLTTQSEILLENNNDDATFLTLILLRFLISWMYEAPVVVQSVLSSPHAAVLSILYSNNGGNVAVGALMNCVLGICMEFMGDESQSGGWTVSRIMDMISTQRGGVGKFTSSIEKLKSIDAAKMPWSSCSLEWSVWMQWYESIVLVVRKRVVQELTSRTTSDDHGDNADNDDDYISNLSSSQNQKSLQGLLSQQANEIEELREQLAKSKMLNISQEKQLSAWKQRVESTPNQLDEMLSEVSVQNADLDQKVMLLEEEIRILKENHQSQLEIRDDKIQLITKELTDSKSREEQISTENEILRDEMTGLNQAYMSLEEEYRRQQGELAAAVASQEQLKASNRGVTSTDNQVRDDDLHIGVQPSPHYNGSTAGSTEISTLRSENARLVNSMKEADDWIAMAMQRMHETEVEMNSLNQAIQELRAHNDTQSHNKQQEQEIRMELESTLADTTSKLNEIMMKCNDLQYQVDVSSNQVSNLLVERDELQSQIEELKKHSLTAQADSEIIDALRREVTEMQNDINTKQERYKTHLLERDARIAELESRLQGKVDNQVAADDIRARDNEIAQLREANNEAQAWINHAVQHHQILSDTLTQLSEENNQLRGQVDDLNIASTSSSKASTSENVAKEIIANQHREIHVLRETVANLEKILAGIQAQEPEKKGDLSDIEIDDKFEGTTEGTVANGVHDEQIQSLLVTIEDREKKIKVLEIEVDELRAHLDASSEHVSKRIVDSEDSARVSELHARISELLSVIEEVSAEKERVSIEMKDNVCALEKVKAEYDSLKQSMIEAGSDPKELLEKINNLESQLTDQEEEHNCVIKEWEETYNKVEAENRKIQEDLELVIVERSSLDNQMKESKQQIEDLSTQLVALQQSVEDHKAYAVRAQELDSCVQRLEDQLKEQEAQELEVVALWEQSYAELNLKLKESADNQAVLQQTISDLKQQLETSTGGHTQAAESRIETGTGVDDKQKPSFPQAPSEDQRVKELEDCVQSLEAQLKDQESQALEVIALWEQSYADLDLKLKESVENQSVLQLRIADLEQELEASINDFKQELETTIAEAEEAVSAWQDTCNELHQQNSDLTERNAGLVRELENVRMHSELLKQSGSYFKIEPHQNINDDTKGSLDFSGVRVDKIVETLNKEVTRISNEAEEAVHKWEIRCSETEKGAAQIKVYNNELLSQINVLKVEKDDSLNDLSRTKEEARQQADRLTEEVEKNRALISENATTVEILKAKINELEEQQVSDEDYFKNICDQWQTSYDALKEELDDVIAKNGSSMLLLENILERLNNPVFDILLVNEGGILSNDGDGESEDVITRLRNRIVLVESTLKISQEDEKARISELTETKRLLAIANQKLTEMRAANVDKTAEKEIAMDAEKRIKRLQDETENERAIANKTKESNERLVDELRNQIEILTMEKAETQAMLEHWQVDARNHCERLVLSINERDDQLRNQNNSYENSIEQWNLNYNDLERRYDEVINEKENLRSELRRMQAEMSDQSTKMVSGGENDGNTVELYKIIKGLEEQITSITEDAHEAVSLWQNSCQQLELEVESLRLEKKILQDKLEERREEVRDPIERISVNSDGKEVDTEWNVDEFREKIQNLENHHRQEIDYFTSVVKANHHSLDDEMQSLKNENNMYSDQLQKCLQFMKTLSLETQSLSTELTDVDSLLLHREIVDKHHDDGLQFILELLRKRFTILSDLVMVAKEERRRFKDNFVSAKESLSDITNEAVLTNASEVVEVTTCDETREFEAVVQNLQQKIGTLELHSREMETRSKDVILELEKKVVVLSEENENFRAELTTNQNSENSFLRDEVSYLAEQISQLESGIETLRVENKNLVSELNATHQRREQANVISSDRNDPPNLYIHSLQLQIKELEEQLREQGSHAEDVVQQWRTSYDMLTAEYEKLHLTKEDLEAEVSEYKAMVSSGDKNTEELVFYPFEEGTTHHKAEVDVVQGKLSETEVLVSQLNEENDTLKQKNKRLESRVSSLLDTSYRLDLELDELKEQKKQLQVQYEELLAAKIELEQISSNFHLETSSRQNAETRLAALEKKFSEAEDMFVARLEKLASEKDQIIASLESSNMVSSEAAKKLKCDLGELSAENKSLGICIEKLKRQLSECDLELRETNSTMQIYLTNRAIENTAQSAAEALRERLGQVIKELEECKETVADERSQREKYEKENERLRVDLATILGIEHNEANLPEIQKRASEATETLRGKERAEQMSLKDTLTRSLEELSAARANEKKLEDLASKASHQAIIYEQQVLSCKNEFHFLTQTIDEMRETESTRRASFEYRIESLENEIRLQRLKHTSEIENLRNEMSQIGMERDRLFQSLKESEKRRESLLNSTSAVGKGDDHLDVHLELRRIQLEKSYLLSACGEEASRFERRLRETRAAEKSAMEADVIFERELRFAAENSLEKTRKEILEVQNELNRLKAEKDPSCDVDQLRRDFQHVKDQLQVASSENAALRMRLETTMKESQASLERLQLEAQHAKARVIHFEQAGHFEAEVRAEQARLLANSSSNTKGGTAANDGRVLSQRKTNLAEEEKERGEDVAVTKLYNYIRKQTQAIAEERSVYMELALKNDELLALLAQLDVLRSSLKEALIEHGGEQVLENAIRNAEAKAKAEFGTFVKFA